MTEKKRVLILSGPPASGKTTAVRKLAKAVNLPNRWRVVSADHFWAPNYSDFDPTKLGLAHASCWVAFTAALSSPDVELVIVDNTNTSVGEIAPYHFAAEALGHDVEIIRVYAPFDVCYERNAGRPGMRRVPGDVMARLFAQFVEQDVQPWWRVRDLEEVLYGLCARCEKPLSASGTVDRGEALGVLHQECWEAQMLDEGNVPLSTVRRGLTDHPDSTGPLVELLGNDPDPEDAKALGALDRALGGKGVEDHPHDLMKHGRKVCVRCTHDILPPQEWIWLDSNDFTRGSRHYPRCS